MQQQQINIMWLNNSDFQHVIAHTPLISMDFVVKNSNGDWLLGQRIHRPAQGAWFVPGGRIRKNENFEAAVERLTTDELGQSLNLAQMRFLGAYEHFYPDSIVDVALSTHYVVLAYQITLPLALDSLPKAQHGHYRWWSVHEISTSARVHANTRAYLPAATGCDHASA